MPDGIEAKVRVTNEAMTAPAENLYVKKTTSFDGKHNWKVGLEKSGGFSGPWQKIMHTVREFFTAGTTKYEPATKFIDKKPEGMPQHLHDMLKSKKT